MHPELVVVVIFIFLLLLLLIISSWAILQNLDEW